MILPIVSLIFLLQTQVHSWSYDDFQGWIDTWAECGLDSQSPIDIPTNVDAANCDDPLILDWTTEIQHFAVCIIFCFSLLHFTNNIIRMQQICNIR